MDSNLKVKKRGCDISHNLLAILHSRVPKQAELRREASEVRKPPNLYCDTTAGGFIHFSASITLIFSVLSRSPI